MLNHVIKVLTFTSLAIAAQAGAQCNLTISQTEGPYYRANPPLRSNFRADGTGVPMDLRGVVRDTSCNPIAGADVDIWHANNAGSYDNVTYLFRGHAPVAADGSFFFETIKPGLYPGRTRHIHAKIRRPGVATVLTTQLYFPGEPGNASDGIYSPLLLMTASTAPDGDYVGTYDFVVPVTCAMVTTQPPTEVSVNPGESTSISLTAGGSLPITYQWKRDGVDLQDIPNAIVGTHTNTLLLLTPTNAQAGTYTCQVNNVCANVSSSPTQLSVSIICDSIDFNNDTSLFDPQDIEAFLSVYSEGSCIPETAACNDIDFNNDTSIFDPCDISSFLCVYEEGPCSPCGV